MTNPPSRQLSLLLLAGALASFTPDLLPGQDVPRPLPADSYADEGTRLLLERARQSRGELAEGLESYEGRMWERLYVGLSAAGFRRERGLFHQERTARIRWSADGLHTLRWEGARRDVPIVGSSSAAPPRSADDAVDDASGAVTTDAAVQLARSLAGGSGIPPILTYQPGSDRISFGVTREGSDQVMQHALHPLADSAGLHYRFFPGDTVRVGIPGRPEPVTIAEIRVQPRRTAFDLLAASLWFEIGTGALVRATYRPARPFNMQLDGDDDVPRMLGAIEMEIRYITVDHGFYDFEWWIPRRFAFEGELRVGRLVRVPASFEWTVADILVNEALDPGWVPEDPPPGWAVEEIVQEEREGRSARTVTVVVPPPSQLGDDPALSPPDERGEVAFLPSELREFQARLEGLRPQEIGFAPRFAWGLQEGLLRYNRVEGLSPGVAVTVPVGWTTRLRGEVRMGHADLRPNAELRLSRGRPEWGEELSVFRRLEVSSEWASQHTLGSSAGTLLLGGEHTPFHRAGGAEVVVSRDGVSSTRRLRVFAERHGSARKGTDWHLRNWTSGATLPPNPEAGEGDFFGAEFRHRWQSGVDPSRARLFTRMRLEGAGGSADYGRGWLGVGVTLPELRGWAAAMEVVGGTTIGDPPPQRGFYPGGAQAYRAVAAGEVFGEAFWLARAELGVGLAAARAVLFADAMEVGTRREVPAWDPDVAVGAGVSLLDGLLRVDVAREVRGDRGWRVMAYLDGLF